MVSLWTIAKLYASLNNILEYYLLSPSKSELNVHVSVLSTRQTKRRSQIHSSRQLQRVQLQVYMRKNVRKWSSKVSPWAQEVTQREQTFVDTFVISHRVDGLIWLPLLSLLLEKLHFMTETEAWRTILGSTYTMKRNRFLTYSWKSNFLSTVTQNRLILNMFVIEKVSFETVLPNPTYSIKLIFVEHQLWYKRPWTVWYGIL